MDPKRQPDGPLVIEIAIEPKAAAELGKLLAALDRLTRDTTSLAFAHDPESRQTLLKGGSEGDLDNAVATLQRETAIGLAVGTPQVAYRETLARRVEIDETYKRGPSFGMHLPSGAHPLPARDTGQFARVKMIFEPTKTGSAFASLIVGGAIADDYIAGVETGIASVMRSGVLAGFPVVDVRATLVDGAYHDGDSSAVAFEMVARAAFRRALKQGGSVLLEPVMAVEITTPEDYLGFVAGDLCARRGTVQGQDRHGEATIVRALVPLANLFGYASQLRSGTQGRGAFTMRFSHYAPAPPPGGDGPAAPAIALRG